MTDAFMDHGTSQSRSQLHANGFDERSLYEQICLLEKGESKTREYSQYFKIWHIVECTLLDRHDLVLRKIEFFHCQQIAQYAGIDPSNGVVR